MMTGAGFDAVLIAASQGGLRVTRQLAAALPADYPAAVLYAQHRSPGASTAVVDLLRRGSAVDVRAGVDGQPLTQGTFTVPPADAHVSISNDRRLVLTPDTPRTQLADGVFASAASVYGPRVLAVVLTGRLRDGMRGVRAVKAAGGRVIVQDPETAEQPSMPWNVLATGCVDLVLDPTHIAAALVALVSVPGAADLFSVRRGSWAASPSVL
jgi:two-component system chemotaxis response regulator CheB